jgi:hypothetical protein
MDHPSLEEHSGSHYQPTDAKIRDLSMKNVKIGNLVFARTAILLSAFFRIRQWLPKVAYCKRASNPEQAYLSPGRCTAPAASFLASSPATPQCAGQEASLGIRTRLVGPKQRRLNVNSTDCDQQP